MKSKFSTKIKPNKAEKQPNGFFFFFTSYRNFFDTLGPFSHFVDGAVMLSCFSYLCFLDNEKLAIDTRLDFRAETNILCSLLLLLSTSLARLAGFLEGSGRDTDQSRRQKRYLGPRGGQWRSQRLVGSSLLWLNLLSQLPVDPGDLSSSLAVSRSCPGQMSLH